MGRPPEIVFVSQQTPENALGQNLLVGHALVHSVLVFASTALAGHPIGIFAAICWVAFIASEICLFAIWNRISPRRLDRAYRIPTTELAIWGTTALASHVICFPISFLTSYIGGCFLWSMLAAQLGLRVASPTMLEKHELRGPRLSLGQLFAVISGVGIALGLLRTGLMLMEYGSFATAGRFIVFTVTVAMLVLSGSFLSLMILTWAGASWWGSLLAILLGAMLPLMGLYLRLQQGTADGQVLALVVIGAVLLSHSIALWPFLASGWRMTFAVPIVESSQGIVYINQPKANASDPQRTV
jgi:hypothetical protein